MSSLNPLIDEGLSSIPGIFCVYMCDGVLSKPIRGIKKIKNKNKGVRFYDCCSNINCRLSRSKKASNINFN